MIGKRRFISAFATHLLALSAAGIIFVMPNMQPTANGQKSSTAGATKPKTSGSNSAQALIKGSDCTACHSENRTVVGPGYREIAKRYKDKPDAVTKLVAKVKAGGSGNWGAVPMTAHPTLASAQLRVIIEWILSLSASKTAAAATDVPSKMFSYKGTDGATVKLDFPLFVGDQQEKVTKAVFHGYENFNSYCYRCHGQDAEGGELAPDLLHSLNGGMSQKEFLSVAMAGRVDKGMPSWAGFLSNDEVEEIYEYVKGRSVGLVSVGRPPSEMD